ncbi:GNAT family N-acetyltransferase [Paenibacillus sp. N3/727]|uniref:GNAT family N-acetyltransferase n=1 Tax=Paenibacillus sp. N3/727 TaxID=2925845 RepID=UPI001F52B776|nr:GNAT family N-acetyltransferase [Paenibacillus sp. N3/727]UNK16051.1 GNAT family N-acetyltransferase [Paenibacillus sp. N3/727]
MKTEEFNGGITLDTKSCNLNEISYDDFEDVKKIYVNEQVRKYLGGAVPEEHTRAKFNDTVVRSFNSDSSFLVVRLKINNQFIGLVSLDNHVDGGIEVSYEFLPAWWGQGFATEVINRVIKYAFEEMGIVKLLAETQTANVSSCNLLERLGMKLERKVQRFGSEQGIFSIENRVH